MLFYLIDLVLLVDYQIPKAYVNLLIEFLLKGQVKDVDQAFLNFMHILEFFEKCVFGASISELSSLPRESSIRWKTKDQNMNYSSDQNIH